MIVVTGASGKLGHHVITELLKTVPPAQIIAAVRDTAKAADLAALGVEVRHADYAQPATLKMAFKGATKVLLISSNEIGQRQAQHQAVIDAAFAAQVELLAYTSILRADTSSLILAVEHLATERAIRNSGLNFAILRNGWYLENHLESLAPAIQHGAILGAAQQGRFASASRADYAAAAAAVLTSPTQESKVYELAGDQSYTLTELAAAVTKGSNQPVTYHDLSEKEYEAALLGIGLPAPVANFLADSDRGASQGELDSTSQDLHTLINRPTTTLAQALPAALTAALAK